MDATDLTFVAVLGVSGLALGWTLYELLGALGPSGSAASRSRSLAEPEGAGAGPHAPQSPPSGRVAVNRTSLGQELQRSTAPSVVLVTRGHL